MVKNIAPLLIALKEELEQHEQPVDLGTLASACVRHDACGHLAILTKPYLEKIVAGQKTIESRFSRARVPPFNKVRAGDVVFLKEVAGPVHAVALTSHVQFFGPLGPSEAEQIMEEYRQGLQLDSDFKTAKQDSLYATLISLEVVLPLKPLHVIKLDRRPWVALADERGERADHSDSIQLHLFTDHQDCKMGLHSYYNSKLFNLEGNPVCKYCGEDSIDWQRMRARDLQDMNYTISQLRTEKFRSEWWLKELDLRAQQHALRKGLLNLRAAALVRLKKSVGDVYEMADGTKRPYRDGFQTPYAGNSIYYAQHALACCCRKCIKCWYGIPYGRNLTEEELTYFAELIVFYVRMKLPGIQEQGLHISRSGSSSDS